jgi:hypothetical protein
MPSGNRQRLSFTVAPGWQTIELDQLGNFGAYVSSKFADTSFDSSAQRLASYLKDLEDSVHADNIVFAGIRVIAADTCDCLTLAIADHLDPARDPLSSEQVHCVFGLGQRDSKKSNGSQSGTTPTDGYSVQYLFRLENSQPVVLTTMSTSNDRLDVLMDEAEELIASVTIESDSVTT